MRNTATSIHRGLMQCVLLACIFFTANAAWAVTRWQPGELSFTATQAHTWSQFPLQVTFTHATSGKTITLDGYWDGGNTWKVRYALSDDGQWNWTASSGDPGLTGSGSVSITAPTATQLAGNRNYRGHVKVGPTGRYFAHADGTPFLYVGDTAWGMNTLMFPLGGGTGLFYTWLNDRITKKFSVTQIAGFLTDRPNEGGAAFPANNFSNLNPGYFQQVDVRFNEVWGRGMVVAMHPAWLTGRISATNSNPEFTPAQAQVISRYFLARYGAYNLVWGLSGEYNLDTASPTWSNPSNSFQAVRDLGAFLKPRNDAGFRHPVSVHPAAGHWIPNGSFSSHYLMHNEPWLDHNWLQTYSFWERIAFEVRTAYGATPAKPVIQSEPCYENAMNFPYQNESLGDRCTDPVMRLQSWTSMLSGAAGYVYGAQGAYFMDDPSALNFVGSTHVTRLVDFFGALSWWTLDPALDCIRINGIAPRLDPGAAPASSATRSEMRRQPRCAGSLGTLYVAYIPAGNDANTIALRNLNNGSYTAQWYNPRSGAYTAIGNVSGVATWTVPARPDTSDWVVLLKQAGPSTEPTPFNGTPAPIPGTVQTEDYDLGGEGVAYHDIDTTNNGNAYRLSEGVDVQASGGAEAGGFDVGWTRAGEWLIYTVNVASAGTYNLEIRVASNGQGGTFHLEFNGVNQSGPITVPTTGGWQAWQTLTRTVNLSAGRQRMRIVMDSVSAATGSVANINYLRFTAVSLSTPFSGTPAPVPGVIQAEDYDLGGQGVAYNDADAPNNGGAYRPNEGVDISGTVDVGGGFDVGWSRAGEWRNYTINVAAAGDYLLEARVASNGQGGTFHVEFGGVDKTGPMTVPNTGGWESWQTVSRTVSLSAGTQVMRVVLDTESAVTNGIGDLNYIRLRPVTYVSDLAYVPVTNGFGPVEKDTSNGENVAGDGRTITLNGVTYAKGLGVHAVSEVRVPLGGAYTRFLSDIGIDDEMDGTAGTAQFEVWADGAMLFQSPDMNATSATLTVDVDVTGRQELVLKVLEGSVGCCDHADWAGARLAR